MGQSSEYRYNGKDRTQIPQIWRCIDGRRQQILQFVKITSSYDKRVECKDKSDKLSEFTLSDENWSQLKGTLRHIDSNKQSIKCVVDSAPLRLPNEQSVCCIS